MILMDVLLRTGYIFSAQWRCVSEMGFDCDEAICFGLLGKVLNVFNAMKMAIHTPQKKTRYKK